jgi:hypothetical protein
MRLLPTLTKDTATFEMEWAGEKIQFTAKRNVLSPRMMKRFADVEKDPMQMAYALAEILASWDIEDVDCTDAEQLANLPVEFLGKVIEKIGETWAGDQKKPEASAAGSAV